MWKQILLPHFWVASTALVIPMNKGIQGVGGSVEAEMMKTLMKKQQLSSLIKWQCRVNASSKAVRMIDVDKRYSSYKRNNHLKSLSNVLTLWYTYDNQVINSTNSITAVRFYALYPYTHTLWERKFRYSDFYYMV